MGEPDGIEQLGGVDFDEAVFNHVVANLGDAAAQLDPDDDAATEALARLRRECVAAKEALSFDTDVMIPVALPGRHTRVRLNRSEFEAMIAPTLADTVAAMHRALRSAQITPADLRSVLLAGGSSRIPLVGELLSDELDRPVVLDPQPEHSIALGAAQTTGPARVVATAPVPVPGPPPETESEPGLEPEETGPDEKEPRRSLVAWLQESPRRMAAATTLLVAVLAGTGLWFVLNASASEPPPPPPPSPSTTVTTSPTPSPTPTSTPPPEPTPNQPTPPNNPRVQVPNVFGLNREQARQRLSDAGLRANFVTKQDRNHTPGTVIGMNPSEGSMVASGTVVAVTIATAAPTSPTTTTKSPPDTPVSPPKPHRP
jgi:hypothetical protein